MGPVVPSVFDHEKGDDLVDDFQGGGEWDASGHAEEFSHWMEKPDQGQYPSLNGTSENLPYLRQLNREMR